jgi:hypothetical protein
VRETLQLQVKYTFKNLTDIIAIILRSKFYIKCRTIAQEFSLPLLIPEFGVRSVGNRYRKLMDQVLLEWSFLLEVQLPLQVTIPNVLRSSASCSTVDPI